MKVDWVPMGSLGSLVRRPVAIDLEATYRQVGVRGFGRGIFDYEPQLGRDLGKLRFFEVEPKRLVVSNIKAWEGAVAATGENESGRIASNRFLTYEVHGALLEYMAQWFLSDRGLRVLGQASPGSADRNRTLSIAKFEATKVPMPSSTDQERIAAHLDRLMAKIGGWQSPSQQLAFREWDGEPVPVSSLVEMIDRSETVQPDLDYAMQGVRWYGEGLFTREVRAGRELSARTVHRIEPGDLVYNRLFAWKQSFAIATEPGWASNEFPTFRVLTDRVTPRLLLALLLSPTFTASVNRASSGSTPTSRNRLKERDFLSLEVPLPAFGRQEAITRHLEIADRARPLERRARQLAAAILPAARNEIFNAMR